MKFFLFLLIFLIASIGFCENYLLNGGQSSAINYKMIQKVISKRGLNDLSSRKKDLVFWLTKSPEERVSTVEYLRRQNHGSSPRLQRTARIIQRT